MMLQRGEEPPPSGGDRSGALLSAGENGESADREPVLLVPTDFTEEANYALKHAQRMGRSMDLSLVLMHVLEGDETEASALQRMEEQADEVCGRGSDDVQMRLVRGVVSEQVPLVASELGAEYVILGSHDVKIPMQHKRSTSLKLLRSGRVPYITVQQPTDVRNYESIVFPVDYTDESQKHYDWLDRLCHYFTPTFHLVRPDVNEQELEDRVDENIANVMLLLSQRGVPYTVRTVPGETEYALEILQVAQELEADLVVVITSADPRQEGRFMLEPHQRRLVLQSAEIPIMTVNPA